MSDPVAMAKSLEVLDKAANDLSKLGFDNMTVSELFFAYGIRVGALVTGFPVFNAARMMIDGMERQSRGG
jgi:hypothetical protein